MRDPLSDPALRVGRRANEHARPHRDQRPCSLPKAKLASKREKRAAAEGQRDAAAAATREWNRCAYRTALSQACVIGT